MDAADIDHNFEPQIRARSNTWPLRPTRELEQSSSPASEDSNADGGQKEKDPLGLTAKKSGSRRNAWGNLSYADLITKAIQSSPEKRLTLSQIYDWMVQNVPYFKDKGDSTSSAGWKNSIRHNLSLHSRFMRIQNEGTGKSSWWVINPDAKPGKAPRRRAGSMETKNYEKKRGRVKKKVEALRAALENGGSPLGSEDYLDTLGFGDFRARTGSNASSCGRLSPIHAGIEPDLHDNQVPPMSPIPWGGEVEDSTGMYPGGDNYSDLVDSLVDGMKLTTQDSMDINGMGADSYLSTNGSSHDYTQSPGSFMSSISEHMSESGQFSHLPAPPPYPDRGTASPQLQPSSILTNLERAAFPNSSYPNVHRALNGYGQGDMYRDVGLDGMGSPSQLSVNTQPQQLTSPDRSQQGSPSPQAFAARLSPQIQRASPQPVMSPLNCQLSPQQHRALIGSPGPRASPSLQTQQQVALQQAAVNASILREALTRGPIGMCQPTTLGSASVTCSGPNNVNSTLLNLGLSPHHHMQPTPPQQHSPSSQLQQHLCNQAHMSTPSSTNFLGVAETGNGGCEIMNNVSMPSSNNSSNNNLPLDIDMESLISVDYDMDQVIKQELTLEGNLDFNFDGINPPATTVSQNIVH